jgi:hypothetical protein
VAGIDRRTWSSSQQCAAILLDPDLAELADYVLPFKAGENGGASLGILLNLLLVPAQCLAWLGSAIGKRAFTSFVV